MRKKCPIDGRQFDATRPSHVFCSARCRKANARRPDPIKPKTGKVVQLAPPVVESDDGEPNVGPSMAEGPLTRRTRLELDEAGRLDTALGVAALIAAIRLDMLGLAETGSGVKALLDAHRAALAEAMKDAKSEDDPLAKIRASAALKLVSGGR